MRRPPTIPPGHEALFQIFVTVNHPIHGLTERPVGPRMARRYLEPTMEAIGKRIASGIEGKSAVPWSSPRLVQVTAPKFETDGLFTREERANSLVGDFGL